MQIEKIRTIRIRRITSTISRTKTFVRIRVVHVQIRRRNIILVEFFHIRFKVTSYDTVLSHRFRVVPVLVFRVYVTIVVRVGLYIKMPCLEAECVLRISIECVIQSRSSAFENINRVCYSIYGLLVYVF